MEQLRNGDGQFVTVSVFAHIDKKYFLAADVKKEFYLTKHIDKNGYKCINKLLEEEGELYFVTACKCT